jgi:2'-5' RNA ligase
LFVAIEPPAAATDHLAGAIRTAQPNAPTGIRWTPAERWHVTLTFCGEVREPVIADLSIRLGRAAARSPAMDLQFAGAGAFGRPSRGTVLWAGLRGDVNLLQRLAAATSAAARRAGLRIETRRYHPHLTIARCSAPADLRRQVEALASYEGPTWSAATLHLVRSTATGGQPVYTDIECWPLGPP